VVEKVENQTLGAKMVVAAGLKAASKDLEPQAALGLSAATAATDSNNRA
jgi:hypothetical protein